MQALDSTKVLGFDPRCQKYNSFVMKINKRIATFILKYHNFDNRPISRPQVLKIKKSILDEGWKLDGDPIRFNTDGNLSEAQHRLTVISEWENEDDEFEVVIVTGVQPESFTKTAPNKPRTARDEIQRKDKEATAEQIATLNDLTQRQGKVDFNINTAIELWNNWKFDIKEGISISSNFLEDTVEWNLGRKAVRSFASLCVRHGYKDEAEVVFDLLKSHLMSNTNTLAGEALELYAEHAASLPNDRRISLIFSILCAMTDIVIKNKNKNAIEGKCQFSYDIDSLNKKNMKQRGVYNKFIK